MMCILLAHMYLKILKKIAHFQTEKPVLSLIILLVLSLMIFGGVSKVKTVASLEKMMPLDIDEIEAFNMLRDNNLGQDMIAVVLQVDETSSDQAGIFDVRDERMYDYIDHLETLLESEIDVRQAYAYTDIANKEDLTNPIFKEQLSKYINNDYTSTMILLSSDVAIDDARMNLLATRVKKDIESVGHPPGIIIKLTGTPIIQQKLGELIAKDRKSTQWISTLLVFLIVMFLFGTFTSALVPIIIVTISVNWLYGTMGYTNLPISTLAGGVAAMVIGIGIDYAIHLMSKFKYERKKGCDVKKSIELAVVETGTALTATSITTMSAFIAFLVGRMPEMGRFGILMVIGVGYSLIFSVFGLPALLVLEEKIIYKIKNKLKFGVEGELSLATKEELKWK